MHKTLIASSLVAVLAAPLVAQAAEPSPFTGNVTIASEYIYRGIAQTNRKPALQGGFDYAHPSGVYVGVWGSSISWISDAIPGASSSLELDLYGGYKGTISGDLGYDVGVLHYAYPGSNMPSGAAKADTTEIYGAITYQWLSVKYSRTTGSLFGWTKEDSSKTRGSGYLDVTGTFDLGDGLSVVAHIGRQSVRGFSDASYTDWKIGVNKDLGVGTLGVAYIDTNAKGGAGEPYYNAYGKDLGKGRLHVSFTKTF